MKTSPRQKWDKIVRPFLPEKAESGSKKERQRAIKESLQRWAADCINSHLHQLVTDLAGKTQPKPKCFLGAMWNQEVDFWLADDGAGLLLAGTVRNYQSRDHFRRNWNRDSNDLIAFTTNLHERFPMCAVLGVISFPEWAVTESDLKKVLNICKRSVPRERPNNAYGKFEGFALAVYNAKRDLIWPFDKTTRLDPASAFTDAANVMYARTISLL